MKALLLTSLFTAALTLVSIHASAEKIGNGQIKLAVQNIFQSDDGLTPQEKIYKLWQEAEGSLPNFESMGTGCMQGVAINSFAGALIPRKYRYSNWDSINFHIEKYSDIDLGFTSVPDLLAGPILLEKGVTVAEYDNSLDIGYSEKEKSTCGRKSVAFGRVLKMKDNRSNVQKFKIGVDEASLVILERDAESKLLLREIAPGLVAGVIPTFFNREAPAVSGYCIGSKAVLSQDQMSVTGWTNDESFKIPGVCSVVLFTLTDISKR